MKKYLGVLNYEFKMGVRRKGMWLAYAVVIVFYFVAIILTGRFQAKPEMTVPELWAMTALLAFMFNLILPVVGGISAVDRLIRDRSLHMDELLRSTGLSLRDHMIGKYLGTLAAICLPVFAGILAFRIYDIFRGAPLVTLGMTVVTFLVVNFPAYAFITAFSLICPLVIPTRVYQVLFTGYWFWGNFLYPGMFPTLSGTVIQASGRIPAEGWFGCVIDMSNSAHFSASQAWMNMFVIAAFIVLALLAGGKYLSMERRQA